MDEPRSLPAVRYYADGTSVLVETLAEFEALAPGHADNPDGPFPTPPAAGWEVHDPLPEAKRLRQEGLSHQAIATALGVSKRTIGRWLKEDDDADGARADTQ